MQWEEISVSASKVKLSSPRRRGVYDKELLGLKPVLYLGHEDNYCENSCGNFGARGLICKRDAL